MGVHRTIKARGFTSPSSVGIPEAIAELRRLVQEAETLTDIGVYFDDVLVPQDAFMDAGEPAEHPVLVKLFTTILAVKVPKAKLIDQRVWRLREHGLWHGGLIFEGGLMAQLIYFDDVNRGVGIASSLRTSHTDSMRFSIPAGLTSAADIEGMRIVGGSVRSKERAKA